MTDLLKRGQKIMHSFCSIKFKASAKKEGSLNMAIFFTVSKRKGKGKWDLHYYALNNGCPLNMGSLLLATKLTVTYKI